MHDVSRRGFLAVLSLGVAAAASTAAIAAPIMAPPVDEAGLVHKTQMSGPDSTRGGGNARMPSRQGLRRRARRVRRRARRGMMMRMRRRRPMRRMMRMRPARRMMRVRRMRRM